MDVCLFKNMACNIITLYNQYNWRKPCVINKQIIEETISIYYKINKIKSVGITSLLETISVIISTVSKISFAIFGAVS